MQKEYSILIKWNKMKYRGNETFHIFLYMLVNILC